MPLELDTQDWKLQLISLFVWISDGFEHRGWAAFGQRMGNNQTPPAFSDPELLTVYLFSRFHGHHMLKAAWEYAHRHLLEFFPSLPSYQTLSHRLLAWVDLLPLVLEELLAQLGDEHLVKTLAVVDSFPIMVAQGRRAKYSRVAGELANFGYCATKNTWYHGLKLHVLALRRRQGLPLPQYVGISPASAHDLSVIRQVSPELEEMVVVADAAYQSQEMVEQMEAQNVAWHASYRARKNDVMRGPDLESWEISEHRQTIESLFSWLERKTSLQKASHVRSTKGLLLHVFGSLLVAFLHWIPAFLNP